ncbi:hypothetical protein SAMN05421749_101659 [Acinetobacter marinus]|uniref:Uncharacterized protein n=2 Tax=Acinetobacter marinus TaxID=281375 RepID=A0A1G6H1X8_9GAMM|nr:hypothetical protein SAMN05421749_101659 [Acinetobacter marinus]
MLGNNMRSKIIKPKVSILRLILIYLVALISILVSDLSHAAYQRSYENLGFELPKIATSPNDCRVYLSSTRIPGWNTTHGTRSEGYSGTCTISTSGSGQIIEMWSGPRNINGTAGNKLDTISAREGTQFVELNAEQLSELSQNVCLVSGETVAWKLSHNGRNASNDTMRFRAGSQSIATMSTSTTGQGSVTCTLGTCNVNSQVLKTDTGATTGTTVARWADYSGTFTYSGSTGEVPMGFESTSGTATSGNFLDAIQISVKPIVEFGSANYSVAENGGTSQPITLNITGTIPTSGLALTFVVTDKTAQLGVDYKINNGSGNTFSVTIPAGDYGVGGTPYTVKVPVEVINDTVNENDEVFSVALQENQNYHLLSTNACGASGYGTATYTIIDDDAPYSMDLKIVKSQRADTSGVWSTDPVRVILGGIVQYQLVMSNKSDNVVSPTSQASFSDNIPSNITGLSIISNVGSSGATSCLSSLTGNILSGQFSGPKNAICTVTIQGTATTGGIITNTANVVVPADNTDAYPSDNTSTVQTNIAIAEINLTKSSIGGVGTFAFTLTGTSQTTGSISTTVSNSAHQVDGNTSLAGVQSFAIVNTGNVTITETLPTTGSWKLTAMTCRDYSTGNAISGTLSGTTFTIPASQIISGKTYTCNVVNTKTPTVKITKETLGGSGGTFNFTNTNLSSATTTLSPVTTGTSNTATATSSVLTVQNIGSNVTITEDALANYKLSNAVCTDANSATTGNNGTFGTVANNTLTIPAANIKSGADITCTFTNQKQRTLTLKKTWVNAKLNDAATLTATGLTDFASVANTVSETDTAPSQAVNVGAVITLGETITTGTGNYNATLACVNDSNVAVPVTSNQITMPDANVTCTYTNSRIAQQLNLKKQWQNATLNHSASVTTTGGTNNPTFNSTATSAGNNATTGTAVTVYAGDVVTLPAETFAGGASASNYTATVACAGGSMLASGATGRTLTISNNTTATECTYTNTNNVKLTDLSITKTDNVDSVYNDTDTTYTIVVTNAGPNAADGAIFKDPVATGLTKSTITCSATGGAVCPTTANLTIANIESSNGLAIPTLPNGGVVTFTVKANVTATSGNVSNVATITAPSGTTDPVSTNNLATDTDSVLTLIVIQGKVFEDNSGTTGIASNAYNAVQNTGEVGIANSTVQLTNCSGTVLATTETDAMGQYQFAVSQATLPSPNFCVVQTNVEGYTSVSGTTGYTRSTDTITVATTGSTYTNLNFGDAKLNLVLTESGQHTVVAGAVTDYPHRLQSDAAVQITGMTQTLNQQPNSASDQDWQALIYRDSNCNGEVDAGEALFNPSSTTPVTLLPSADICLVQRVHVPTNAYAGAQHNAQLEASYSVTLSNSTPAITGTSNQVQDTTMLGSAGLELSKKVRKVASCPSTSADTTVFSTSNEATTLDKLEYEITYKNNSVKNLQNVKVKDAVPTGTTFGSISCESTPSGNSCTPTHTGEALLWQLTGNLTPASSGTVRFCVTPQ